MKHIPSLVGVAVLFAIVYFLSNATLTRAQFAIGGLLAVLVYSATVTWHIRNLLREP